MSQTSQTSQPAPVLAPPWWKFGMVWMVIAGPAAVVVAGFATLYLAVTRPDPVVSENYYREGLDINKTLARSHPASVAPALQGRNHAATGVQGAAPTPRAP